MKKKQPYDMKQHFEMKRNNKRNKRNLKEKLKRKQTKKKVKLAKKRYVFAYNLLSRTNGSNMEYLYICCLIQITCSKW